MLSYTPVVVPFTSGTSRTATFLRRDLFDARFQVLNQGGDDDEEEEEAAGELKGKGKEKEVLDIDEQTDLVKGVYEGGLKTWECSLDLVDLLDSRGYAIDEEVKTEQVRGKSVLEVRATLPLTLLFPELNFPSFSGRLRDGDSYLRSLRSSTE